ncbi:MAG: tyrosine-type recombinase/integrase, partial [Anaerovoracaceae bacterium]
IEEGRVVIANTMTVQQWGEICIDTYKTNLEELTLINYRSKINRWIYRKIGHLQIKNIKPLHCQQILNEMAGYSSDTIKKVNQMLSFIFSKAVDNQLILLNPAKDLTRPKGTVTARRSITEHERATLLLVAKTYDKYLYFLFMLYCGCRPSEAAEIKRMDIQDINSCPVLHIRGTKSKAADRYVPIPDELFYVLPKISPFEYFVTNLKGQKLNENNRNSLWKHLRRDMNIAMGCKVYRNQLIAPYPLAIDFTPYCLRHTYCTDLQDYGVDIRVAQKLMGHSSIDLTANIYTHSTDQSIINAAALINGDAHKGATQGATLKGHKRA